jgi:hypothetical protein
MNFSIGAVSDLLKHIEKLHKRKYIQLFQERRDSLNVLNEAMMNLSDEVISFQIFR